MRATVEGEGDVSEEAVRLRDREARQVTDPVRRGMTRRFAGPFRYRERVCFHTATRRPTASGRSTALVICRAKIAVTPRDCCRANQTTKERNYEREFLWLGWSRGVLLFQGTDISNQRLDLVVSQFAAERFHGGLAVFLY